MKIITKPKEIIAYIKVYFLFKKVLKNYKERFVEWPYYIFRGEYKKRSSEALRDFYCSILKFIRTLYPFIPNDKYSEWKKMYEEQLEVAHSLKVGDWITVISSSWIEKGLKFAEYDLVGMYDSYDDSYDDSPGRSYKIKSFDEKYKRVFCKYGDINYGRFRKATEEEIIAEKQKRIKDVLETMEQANLNHQKHIEELSNKIEELKNS